MLYQEGVPVPTGLTKSEKRILTCLFLEGAFFTDTALGIAEVLGALPKATPMVIIPDIRGLCETGYLVYDLDDETYCLSPYGNLFTGVLLGATPKEKWKWMRPVGGARNDE